MDVEKLCTYYWSWDQPFCRTIIEPWPPIVFPPPVPKDCELVSSSKKFVIGEPIIGQPSNIWCMSLPGFGPSTFVLNKNDSNNCAKCSTFPGYPSSYFSNFGTKMGEDPWKSTGQKNKVATVQYKVEWTITMRCKTVRYGQTIWTTSTFKPTTTHNATKYVEGGYKRAHFMNTFFCPEMLRK